MTRNASESRRCSAGLLVGMAMTATAAEDFSD